MLVSDTNLPLYVDLDGTLIKTDAMFESTLRLLKRNPLYLLLMPFWLLRGRAWFKQQLAQRVELDWSLLPFNPELLTYLNQQKSRGRELVLISASDEQAVSALHAHLNLFDRAIGSDSKLNLKARAKLARIQSECKGGSFAYAGNSIADIPIWEAAEQILMVNCSQHLAERFVERAQSVTQFDTAPRRVNKFFTAIRPHHWLKNGLIFAPLVLSHQIDNLGLLLQSLLGFISFSLCASSVYLLNDMLDLDADRLHPSKRERPFAAGELSLAWGIIGAPLLLISAFVVAALLPAAFMQILLLYWLITVFYSFYLKRLFLLDALTLAGLYTLRILAGSAAISVTTTNWLLGFSLCLFLGLALLKRYTELANITRTGDQAIQGRGYAVNSRRALGYIGAGISLLAILVFMFYISTPDITQLYSRPFLLWLISPLLLFLLWRIWSFAREGKLDEDPIQFAATDRLSQLVVALCGLILWLAT